MFRYISIFVFLISLLPSASISRMWTSKKGDQIEAVYERQFNLYVVLRTSDDKLLRIHRNNLSIEDQNYIKHKYDYGNTDPKEQLKEIVDKCRKKSSRSEQSYTTKRYEFRFADGIPQRRTIYEGNAFNADVVDGMVARRKWLLGKNLSKSEVNKILKAKAAKMSPTRKVSEWVVDGGPLDGTPVSQVQKKRQNQIQANKDDRDYTFGNEEAVVGHSNWESRALGQIELLNVDDETKQRLRAAAYAASDSESGDGEIVDQAINEKMHLR